MEDDTIDDLDAEIAKLNGDEVVAESEVEPETEPKPELEADQDDEPDDPEPKKEAKKEEPKSEDVDDLEQRVRRLHIEAREAKRAAQAAQREAEIAKGNIQLPRDEAVINEAQQLAKQIASQQMWDKECNRIAEAGAKDFADFDKVIEGYKTNFGGSVPSQLIEGALEVMPGQEAKLLHYLGRNLDVAEHIMSLSPVKAGAALAKLADKISAKPTVSKAPAPIKPVSGGSSEPGGGRTGFYEGMSTEAFMRMEAKERRARR